MLIEDVYIWDVLVQGSLAETTDSPQLFVPVYPL